ncbi:ABC transporter ATP-binding protein [Pilimelia terevasa]|uniref:ABC transporter ATP-binding protein n=1 Tax=Pilimelia terevasa TaxID=53372 RepID=A0A8J3BQM7_9ACTN|nr:ABC transporter ATP-binding protein [Pilimelia terevasa]GGK41825.1 ABC transporter ATP-binding protein [Pilimelia terevasa]
MIRRLLATLPPADRRRLRVGVALTVAAALAQGAAYACAVPFLRALLAGRPAAAWAPLGWLAGAAAVYAVAHVAATVQGRRTGYALARTLLHRMGNQVSGLPLGWFTPRRSGELAQLATRDIMTIMSAPGHLLGPVLTAFVTPAAVAAVLLVLDWRLGVAAGAAAPVIVASYRWTGAVVRRTERGAAAAAAESAARVVEFATVLPALRAAGRAEDGLASLEHALGAQRAAGRAMARQALPAVAGFAVAVQAGLTAVLVVAAVLGLGGRLDAGTALAALVLAARCTEPMLVAAQLGAAVRMAGNALDRVAALAATPTLPAPTRPQRIRGDDISFTDVRMTFGGTRALDGVSFTAPAGGRTALVGPSGAGKSTVAALIARFHDPDAGTVRVGGADLRQVPTPELMARLSLVFQDVYLFDGTLWDNIAVGRPDAGPDAVRAAAADARVDEIAGRLPRGYDTPVGPGGALLSGGERQRVSLARALLADTPIVILDEATAALDAENEAAVTAAVARFTAGRTVVVIAHRLETVRHADQILFLDAGRIVERGTHETLVAAGGRYARFCAQRAEAAGWQLRAVAGDPAAPVPG